MCSKQMCIYLLINFMYSVCTCVHMCTQCTCMPPRTHAKTHMHACGWPMHKYEHGVTRVQTCVFLISCLAMHTHVLYNRMFAYECSVNFSCVIDKYDLYSYEYFLFVFEFLCTLIYTYIHTHVYWCMYSCMYLCAVQLLHILNQWMCTPFYLNTYIYMYTYVYIHTAHLHIHIHICIYIWICVIHVIQMYSGICMTRQAIRHVTCIHSRKP